MNKFLKSTKGFSLAEIMIATAIAGVIGLVGYSALKSSNQAGHIKIVDNEVNHLKNLLIGNLADPATCANNFKNQAAANPDIPNLKIKDPTKYFLERGQSYGDKASDTSPGIVSITNISTVRSGATVDRFIVKVDYSLRVIGKPGKTKNLSFQAEVFAKFSADGLDATIKDCFLDVAGMIRTAVKYSCRGDYDNTLDQNIESGAHYYEPGLGSFGECHHDITLQDSSGTPIGGSPMTGPSQSCPLHEFISQSTSITGVVTFKCTKYPSVAPLTCPAWWYAKSFNNLGEPDCHKLSEFVPSGNLVATGVSAGLGVFTPISVGAMSCGADQVLRRLSPKTCAPKLIAKSCPANQYIQDVAADGTLTCVSFVKKSPVCPAGQYLASMTASGNATCLPLTINASCPAGYLLSGADSNGNATRCVPSL
ncbi:MAG: prepilin-type N-terminal cleavage/methylation domain-containing protein [Bacteriovorax sp.]|nr:prepilin-type N-terminal cleavage/methylation domain-containing protein [Bacteriovorax sp.]